MYSSLKKILHGKLYDPWPARRSGCGAAPAVTICVVVLRTAKDFAESIRCAQGGRGISGPQAVGDVERLRAKFQPFSFGDLEVPRYGLIPFPKSRPDNVALASVPVSSLCRNGESRRIEIVRQR